MADFFEQLGKKISDVAEDFGKKTEDTLEVQRIKSQIRSLDRANERDYIEIGKKIYEKFKAGEVADLEYIALCESIEKREEEAVQCQMLLMAAGGLLVVLVCVDMGIKQYIEENFEEEEERETILDKVVLRKVYNKGFCFNTLDKKPELVRKTSGILCAGLAIYDAWLFLKKGKWLRKFGMVFLTAGAISNTYDRLIRGKVIDYIGIQWKNSRLRRLTANLADVYVVIGAAVTGVAKIFRR